MSTTAPSDVAAPSADAETTSTGLAHRQIRAGTGTEHPAAKDTVEVHYSGWTSDGALFDSSLQRGQTTSFPLDGVIPGWTEGVQLMVEGEMRRFWIPGRLAYGDRPSRPGTPAGQLTFDIELISIKKAVVVETPANCAAPPEHCTTTASGLAYLVIEKGDGNTHPTATNQVKVHYSGWTADGELFDSSVQRGSPATFPLNRVIAGWTEGLQLMTVGEKARFWIPAGLAYGDNPRPGAPVGQLTFDVELLEILR